LSEKSIPGVAWNLRILLLGQTREVGLDELVGGLEVKEETVLEHVVRSDAVRERLLAEADGMFSLAYVNLRRKLMRHECSSCQSVG
jgi:hypothetical protein